MAYVLKRQLVYGEAKAKRRTRRDKSMERQREKEEQEGTVIDTHD